MPAIGPATFRPVHLNNAAEETAAIVLCIIFCKAWCWSIITLHIARKPTICLLPGNIQVVVCLTKTIIEVQTVSEVLCLFICVTTKTNMMSDPSLIVTHEM